MTRLSNPTHRTLSLDLLFDAPINEVYPPVSDRSAQRRSPSRPLVCSFPEGKAIAHPAWLPFPDASMDEVICIDQLAFIRREEDLLAEIGRVTKPGGHATIRVPAVGMLAGFDALNLIRYLHDITHHGVRPPETSEIGWNKHFPEDDLRRMLDRVGFTIENVVRSRFIVSELLDFGLQIRHRWWKYDPRAYAHQRRKLDSVRRFEDRLRFPGGFLITITAVKSH